MWLPETAVDLAIARGAGRGRDRLHDPVAAPGQPRPRDRRRRLGATCRDGAIDPTTRLPRTRCRRAARSRSSSTTARSRARSRSSGCCPRASCSPSGWSAAFSERARDGRSSSTSRPTARPTATTTGTATWRWPTRSTPSSRSGLARLTNYGEFLETHPPTHEVRIVENTSWSCAHGVERWRSDCGCQHAARTRAGTRPGARRCARRSTGCATRWRRSTRSGARGSARGPLGGARRLRPRDPATARPRAGERFLRAHAAARASPETERIAAWKLLELQRHALLMYTSCGWFFDDVGGIETRQILQYAGARAAARRRALRRGPRGGVPRAPGEGRRATRRRWATAAASTRSRCAPAMVSLERVGAHYGVSARSSPSTASRPASTATASTARTTASLTSGRARLALGRVRVTSEITGESAARGLRRAPPGRPQPLRAASLPRSRATRPSRSSPRSSPSRSAGRTCPRFCAWSTAPSRSGVYTLRLLFRDERQRILGVILQLGAAARPTTSTASCTRSTSR